MTHINFYPFKVFVFFVFYLFFSVYGSYAQNDSMRLEIKNFNDDFAFSVKGRRLLSRYFSEGNLKKVKKIKDILMEDCPGDNFIVFYPNEYYLILFWVNEYNELLSAIDHPVQGVQYPDFYFSTLYFYPDTLYKTLLKASRDNIDTLEKQINDSDIGDVEKGFLSLYLKNLISGHGRTYFQITQDTVNKLADEFLKKYPDNIYKPFVINNIKYVVVPADWGYSVLFLSGYGFFTNDIKKYVGGNVPVVIGLDVNYKRAVLYGYLYNGFASLSKDITYSEGVWEAGSPVQVMIPQVSLGYNIKNGDVLKIAPFTGIASTMISPSSKDLTDNEDLKKADRSATTFILGTNFDIFPFIKKKHKWRRPYSDTDFLIKVRYTFGMTRFGKKYSGFKGNIHTITVGIGLITRNFKRVY